MRHKRIPGVVNIFEVNDPQEIKSLADDPVIDRYFETHTCPINWFLLKRSLSVLSFRGRRFPTMEPRHWRITHFKGDRVMIRRLGSVICVIEGMNMPPLAIHAVPNGEKAVEALVI